MVPRQIRRLCGFFARESDEAVLVGDSRRLRAVLDAELPVDVREVELHRLLGDPELLADLLVREAARECRQQGCLTLAQAENLAGPPRRLELAVDRERIAVGRGSQRHGEVARVAGLRHEAARAALPRRV